MESTVENVLVDSILEIRRLSPFTNISGCSAKHALHPQVSANRYSSGILRQTYRVLIEIQIKFTICARSKTTKKPRSLIFM